MSHLDPPRRVRVTAPRGERAPVVSVTSQIDAETRIGEIYVDTLVRTQRRLAVRTALWLLLTVGALPLLFRLAPDVVNAHVGGVPVCWWVLGAGVYPWLFWLARRYVAAAERNEADFGALVSSRPGEVPAPGEPEATQ